MCTNGALEHGAKLGQIHILGIGLMRHIRRHHGRHLQVRRHLQLRRHLRRHLQLRWIGLVRRTIMRQKTDVTVIVERTTLTVTSRVRGSMDVIPRSTPVRAHPGAHARRIKMFTVAASCFSMIRAQAITAAPASALTRCHSRVTVPASRMATRGMVQTRASSWCINGTRKLNRGGAWLRSGGNPQVMRPVIGYPFPGMVLAWRCTLTGTMRSTRGFRGWHRVRHVRRSSQRYRRQLPREARVRLELPADV